MLAVLSASPVASAQSYDIKALNSLPASSLADAIAGALPWVRVDFESADPGAAPRITLRGECSASGCTPLVLVDGVEMPIELLDASTVETIEVLRDAAASAIYGARAAAGAILITTKNAGSLTKAEDSFNAAANVGAANSSLTHAYKLGACGGDDGFSYFFGGNYYGTEGFNKVGFVANANARITPWFTYSLGLDYNYNGRNVEQGSYSYDNTGSHYALLRNRFTAKIIEGLEFGLSYNFSNDYTLARRRATKQDGLSDSYAEGRRRFSESDIVAELNFDRSFSDVHHVKAAAGADIQSGADKYVIAGVAGLIDPNYSVLTIGDGRFDVGESKNNYFQCGFFARAAYEYDSRYNASLTFREDGTSRLAKSNRWAPTVAASFAWTVSEEPFFASAGENVDFLKLSYGFASVAGQHTGALFPWYGSINNNAGTSSFLFDRAGLGSYASFNYPVSGSLCSERIMTHNLALESAFLGTRLNLGVDIFARKADNMINPYALVSGTFGAPAPLMNQGSAFSAGADIALGWSDTAGELGYRVSAMASYHSRALDSIVDPCFSMGLSAGLDWKGLDFSVSGDALGAFDEVCLRNVTAGYTFQIRNMEHLKSIRAGVAARNIHLAGMKYPMWLTSALSINF